MEDTTYLAHHGILGMHWGIRRYQNEDGSLTEAGRRRLEKKDVKFLKRNEKKITKTVQREVKRDMKDYDKHVLSKEYSKTNADGSLSLTYANAYNRKLAELMNANVGDIPAPSGRVVRFVAKRGDIGVNIALASPGYDMSQVKSGVYASGKVAYQNKTIKTIGD